MQNLKQDIQTVRKYLHVHQREQGVLVHFPSIPWCLPHSVSCKHCLQLLLLLSRFSRVQLCATPQTAAKQAPLSLGFSRQEHWNGLPFPSPTQTAYLKQRHNFANRGLSRSLYGFYSCHVWMWDWTTKKAEAGRIDAFELWCWRRLLRVPWTARRSNQSILKEISLEYSLEGLLLKLKLQYVGHLI